MSVQLVLSVLAALALAVSSTQIPGVCAPVTGSSDKTRPIMPEQFRVSVECSMLEQNRTVYVREYYDYGANIGRITQTDMVANGDAFFDYDANEVILVDLKSGLCLVGDLSTSDDRWMFGYKVKGGGMPHIFGASGALHFGDSPEAYAGEAVVRGIKAYQWDSCQYSEALNATMSVSWYFSSKTEWDMQLGARSVPLRAIAVGKYYKNGVITDFNHIYDFYRFEEYIRPDDFTIPAGVYCPGRIHTKQFPKIPDRFSFNGEIFDRNKNVLTYVEEAYDKQSQINVYRYKQDADSAYLQYQNRMLQVNDFNTGVSYIIDEEQGSCQLVQIGYGGYSFVEYLDHGKVRMKTPAEFFQDQGVSYIYSGVRQARGINCDVWVATTDKIQGYTDQNLTIEWYFAVSSDTESWNSFSSEYRLPVMFRMFKFGDLTAIWEYNLYYFDTSRPQMINADITPCFHAVDRRRFTFDLDIASKGDVFDNLEMFKYALKSAVSLFTGISQLRVADIEVYYDASAIHVSFDLLGKPTLGGDTYNQTLENSLNDAAKLYQDAMDAKMIQLSVVVGANVATLKPIPGTSAEISYATSSGFSTGALAGLGIAMLLVGGGGGAGVAFFFFK